MSWGHWSCFIYCILTVTGLGCASGPSHHVEIKNEVPTDLPSDLKDRFEVKEAYGHERSPLSHSGSGSEKSKKATDKKSTAKNKKNTPKKTQNSPFAYPVRRPSKDPIWVGEKLTYSISYLGMSAGDLVLDVLPFKLINGRKVYHIRATATSSAVFSIFYRLNDIVESFIDYEGSFSHRFHLILDESKQTRDALELNDSEKAQTYYWNRWNHKTNGYKETKETAAIQPFSQDSLSALFYVRTIPLPMGSVVTFPVVSEGKTWEAVCTILRNEEMNTPVGRVNTIVIQPEMKFHGILKKSGNSFLWVTDDDRRIPIRLEAKVRIGTVIAQLRIAELGKLETKEAPVPSPQPEIK